jgi:hypothetical protein
MRNISNTRQRFTVSASSSFTYALAVKIEVRHSLVGQIILETTAARVAAKSVLVDATNIIIFQFLVEAAAESYWT